MEIQKKIEAWLSLATVNPKLSEYMVLVLRLHNKQTLNYDRLLKALLLISDTVENDTIGNMLGRLAYDDLDVLMKIYGERERISVS